MRSNPRFRILALLIVLCPVALFGQLESNSLLLGWVPTEAPPDGRYQGSSTCIQCHTAQAHSMDTAMARALQPASESRILLSKDHLSFTEGPYRYEIVRQGNHSVYTVTDGTETVSEPLLWSFGQGKVGQTYLFARDGAMRETRVSFYLDPGGLDFTLGVPLDLPATLEEAVGRFVKPGEMRGCFGCHSTGAVRGPRLALDELTPGVTCEGCHGAGIAHTQAVRQGNLGNLAINNLKGMNAEEQSNFCGSCHRTWSQVILMGIKTVDNVRFQPYRLANSPCYDTEDARIGCTACHDPHKDPVHEASYYDTKCLACHAPGVEGAAARVKTGRACPVGQQKCSDCHMPKVDVLGAHYQFTDHWIRIARPGDPYPN
jgi:hypothetical protein